MKQDKSLFLNELNKGRDLLLGDSVLLQLEDGRICRPSDIGEPVDVVGSWTLKFSNGIRLTTYGNQEFKLYNIEKRNPTWERFNNLYRGSIFGFQTKMNLPEGNKNYIINLADYTSSEKEFDLGDVDFAYTAGLYCGGAKRIMKYPNSVCLPAKKVKYKERVSKFLQKELYEVNESYFMIRNCWITELLDNLLDMTGIISLPDSLMLDMTAEWWSNFRTGFFDMTSYDTAGNYYKMLMKFEYIISDLAIVNFKIGNFYEADLKYDLRDDTTSIVVRFPSTELHIRIIDGWENKNSEVLYDIGKGIFNASGIVLRDM